MIALKKNLKAKTDLLPVFLAIGAISAYLWSVFVFYPIAKGYVSLQWLLALTTGLIFSITYLIQRLGTKNDKAVRTTTRVFTALLITLTLASIFLMVIPYVPSHSVADFFYQDPYKDPSSYSPYSDSWGEVGGALRRFAIYAFSPWTYHLVVMCLIVLAFDLIANRSKFTRLERRLHWSIFILCGLFFLLMAAPWPWITYWIID